MARGGSLSVPGAELGVQFVLRTERQFVSFVGGNALQYLLSRMFSEVVLDLAVGPPIRKPIERDSGVSESVLGRCRSDLVDPTLYQLPTIESPLFLWP